MSPSPTFFYLPLSEIARGAAAAAPSGNKPEKRKRKEDDAPPPRGRPKSPISSVLLQSFTDFSNGASVSISKVVQIAIDSFSDSDVKIFGYANILMHLLGFIKVYLEDVYFGFYVNFQDEQLDNPRPFIVDVAVEFGEMMKHLNFLSNFIMEFILDGGEGNAPKLALKCLRSKIKPNNFDQELYLSKLIREGFNCWSEVPKKELKAASLGSKFINSSSSDVTFFTKFIDKFHDIYSVAVAVNIFAQPSKNEDVGIVINSIPPVNDFFQSFLPKKQRSQLARQISTLGHSVQDMQNLVGHSNFNPQLFKHIIATQIRMERKINILMSHFQLKDNSAACDAPLQADVIFQNLIRAAPPAAGAVAAAFAPVPAPAGAAGAADGAVAAARAGAADDADDDDDAAGAEI